MKTKLILVAFAFSGVIIAQPTVPYWKLGGNPNPPATDGVNTANNFLGTAGVNNNSVRIGTAGTTRIHVNQGTNSYTSLFGVGNTGYLGIGNNVAVPRFHLDINTPALPGQAEVFIGAGPTDVPNSKMGLMNAASGNGIFFPYVYGKTDATQIAPALTTLANIDAAQDVAPSSNANPVQMFRVGSGFNFYTSSVAGMNNRLAFTWVNGNSTHMMMNAGGRVRIGNNLSIPGNLPNNRLELTASTGDPYFGGLTGGSGLRFTNLTSAKATIPNGTSGVNSAKVLTVDGNGDVVLTDANAVPTTNNGISVNAAGVVQLGVPCTLPSGAPNFPGLSATQLTQDRAIYIANQNFWFGNANAETGGVGVGGHPTSTGWCNTGNTFEISANSKNTKYGSFSASGLRLTKLLSTSPTVPNGTYGVNSSKVLTVDQDGDVVLTDASAGLGNIGCAATQNPLASNWEIPLANHSFIFSGQAANDNVGVGTTCAPIAKFQVQDNTGAIATSAIGYKVAGGFLSTHSNGLSASMAAINTSNVFNSTAGYFQGNPVNKVNAVIVPPNGGYVGLGTTGPLVQLHVVGGGGVQIDNGNLKVNNASIQVNNPNATGISVAGNKAINAGATTNGLTNYAGYFFANGAANNYAIYAESPIITAQTTSVVGSPANYAGYFNGDVVRTGTDNFTSDANLKQNIDTITNALGIINQLKPKSYEYKQSSFPSMSLPSGKQYGLIAQDVQTVLPELVNNSVHPAKLDSAGNVIVPSFNYLSLEYQQLTGIMIKAIQEQQAKIDSLTKQLNSKDSIQDARLTALENAINQCCSSAAARNNNSNLNQLDIELSDKDAIVLNQNVPNPFAEQTTITYNVPASVGKAQIIFFNTNGQIIQTVDIKTRGKGKVNVFASDLSSGLYNYTLVADGKVIDSKKMVRE